MEDKIKVSLELKTKTIESLEKVAIYYNIKKGLKEEVTIEDIIKAGIAEFLDHFFEDKSYVDFTDREKIEDMIINCNLNKPYQLQNRFKEIAKEQNLKQVYLVEKTKITKSNLSQILNNKTQPSLDYFIRLWVATNCLPINKVLYRKA